MRRSRWLLDRRAMVLCSADSCVEGAGATTSSYRGRASYLISLSVILGGYENQRWEEEGTHYGLRLDEKLTSTI